MQLNRRLISFPFFLSVQLFTLAPEIIARGAIISCQPTKLIHPTWMHIHDIIIASCVPTDWQGRAPESANDHYRYFHLIHAKWIRPKWKPWAAAAESVQRVLSLEWIAEWRNSNQPMSMCVYGNQCTEQHRYFLTNLFCQSFTRHFISFKTSLIINYSSWV